MCAGFSWATGHQLPALVSFVYRCTFRLLQLCLSVFEVRAAFSGQPALWTTINTVEAGCACDTTSCAHAKKASPSHYSVLRSPRGIRDPCIVETLYAVGALPSMAEADAGGRAHMLDSRVGAADAVMDVASARRHGLSGAVPQHRVESQLKAGSPSLVTLPSRSYGAVGRDAGRAQEQRSPPNQGRDPLWAGPRKAPPTPQRRFRFLNCGRLEEASE